MNKPEIFYDTKAAGEGLNALSKAVGWTARTPAVWNTILNRADYFIAAYDGKKCVGFARIFTDGKIWGIVADVAVHPDYRRRKIGAGLMSRIAARAKEKGLKTLRLFAAADESPFIYKFYNKCGFERMHNAMRLKGLAY